MPSNPFKAEPSSTRLALNRIGLRVRNLERRFSTVSTVSGGGSGSGAAWTLIAEPLISPTVAWEQNKVFDPDVHYESGTYKMWYTGGSTNPGIGYAECSSDPTIPGNWTKHAGNPVLGQGGSSIAGDACRIMVVKVGGTYHCFYSDVTSGLGALKRSTSTDGLSWTTPTTAIPASGSGGVGSYGWAHTAVWHDGTYWWLFVEGSANSGGGSPWDCWLFRNTDITNDGGWVVQNGGNSLTTLAYPGYGRGYGQGPNIAEIDGTQTFQIGSSNVLWYHIQKSGSPSDTTDITHVFGTDPGLVEWKQSGVLDIAHNGSAFEKDQVADPCVLQVAGTSYLFFDGDDNETPFSCISLATYPGTLSAFLSGATGSGGSGTGGTSVGSVASGDGSLTVTNPSGPTVDLAVAKVDGGSA